MSSSQSQHCDLIPNAITQQRSTGHVFNGSEADIAQRGVGPAEERYALAGTTSDEALPIEYYGHHWMEVVSGPRTCGKAGVPKRTGSWRMHECPMTPAAPPLSLETHGEFLFQLTDELFDLRHLIGWLRPLHRSSIRYEVTPIRERVRIYRMPTVPPCACQ